MEKGEDGEVDIFISPYINHFVQPDSIIPDLYNPQSLNRYSYVQNNPIRFNDPTGHKQEQGGGGKKCLICQDIVEFDETYGDGFTDDEKDRITKSAEDIARRMAGVLNNYCMKYGSLDAECTKVHPTEAFLNVFDGPVTFKSHTQSCAEHFNQPSWNCWGMAGGSSVWVFSNAPANRVAEVMQFPVHEIFHIFDNKVTGRVGSSFAISDPVLMGRSGLDDGKNWQQHKTSPSEDKVGNETFADIGIAWTYNHYNLNPKMDKASSYTMNAMNNFMEVQIVSAYYGVP